MIRLLSVRLLTMLDMVRGCLRKILELFVQGLRNHVQMAVHLRDEAGVLEVIEGLVIRRPQPPLVLDDIPLHSSTTVSGHHGGSFPMERCNRSACCWTVFFGTPCALRSWAILWSVTSVTIFSA